MKSNCFLCDAEQKLDNLYERWEVACVASVSVWFRSKEIPILAEREMKREPPRSFTGTVFRTVFDSLSSFFAPKPHGNVCYAG